MNENNVNENTMNEIDYSLVIADINLTSLEKIWIKRILAGSQSFSKAPSDRKHNILVELRNRVLKNEINAQIFEMLTGMEFSGVNAEISEELRIKAEKARMENEGNSEMMP